MKKKSLYSSLSRFTDLLLESFDVTASILGDKDLSSLLWHIGLSRSFIDAIDIVGIKLLRFTAVGELTMALLGLCNI